MNRVASSSTSLGFSSLKVILTLLSQWKNVTEGSGYSRPGDLRGGALADTMGLGKTLSVICLLAMDWSHCPRDSSGQRPTLLVVPPSLLATWEAELGKQSLGSTIFHKVFVAGDIMVQID